MKPPKPPEVLKPVTSPIGQNSSKRKLSPVVAKPWWPEEYGSSPDGFGWSGEGQFAYFANALRLIVRVGEEMVTYNTRGFNVRAVVYTDNAGIVLQTDRGNVPLAELRKV